MTYTKTIEYLFSQLPMFTKIGETAYKKDLYNIVEFCKHLNQPQEKFKTIHIGGTNGKGSSSHILASILQQADFKVGLYTSPHLKDFRERIRINGKTIDKRFVTNFISQHKPLLEQLKPSFFETTVALAFDYFANEKVDIAIIEVGLGGRLDSTNVIYPELSIITNISLDHTNILGDTRTKIAFEKAGIIKKNAPVIIGEHHPETDSVFIQKAKDENTEIFFAQDQYSVQNVSRNKGILQFDIETELLPLYQNLELDLTGTYQEKNILSIIKAVNILRQKGYNIADASLIKGLKNVKKNTGLMGRWQTLQKSPLIICDTGHNEAGIKEVVNNINLTNFKNLHLVIGMVKDKDISKVLQLLPKNATYYFCQPNLERALPVEELAIQANNFSLKGSSHTTVISALNAAKENAHAEDLIFVGGSTFVVAEVVK